MTPRSPGTIERAVRVPGTCGELAQGHLDGHHVLITCPIDRFATATVCVTGDGSGRVDAAPDIPKSRAAVQAALTHAGRPDADVTLRIESDLPRGKGMASSTADVAGAIGATFLSVGVEPDPETIARIAIGIEPSDGVMLPGIAMLDQRSGTLLRSLGPAPRMRVVVVDPGGSVDTVALARATPAPHPRQATEMVRDAVASITAGVRTADLAAIGHGATLSALAHQALLPNPCLDAARSVARSAGAHGITVAHSGVVLGVLLDDDPERERWVVAQVTALPGVEAVMPHRLMDGGLRPA